MCRSNLNELKSSPILLEKHAYLLRANTIVAFSQIISFACFAHLFHVINSQIPYTGACIHLQYTFQIRQWYDVN